VAEDGEASDAQLVGNLTGVSGRRRDGRAALGSRASVTGTVVADPPDTTGARGLEQWLGRRTRVRGAVMPQDDQLVGASGGTHVVRVKDTPVVGADIDLADGGLLQPTSVLPRGPCFCECFV
jgi:hypothetical protein